MNLHTLVPLVHVLLLVSLGLVTSCSGERGRLNRYFAAFCYLLAAAAGNRFLFTFLPHGPHTVYLVRITPIFALLSMMFGAYYAAILADRHQGYRAFGREIRGSTYFAWTVGVVVVCLALALPTDLFVRSVGRTADGALVPEMGSGMIVIGLMMLGLMAKILWFVTQALRQAKANSRRVFLILNLTGFIVLFASLPVSAALYKRAPAAAMTIIFVAVPLAVLFFYLALTRYHYERWQELNRELEERVVARTLELQRAQVWVIQSEKMASMGQLVAGVAHEVNTPIGAIHSMHGTLSQAVKKLERALDGNGGVPADIARTLQVIEEANRVIGDGSQRVGGIVRRLKSFARLDEAELKVVDVHIGLDDTIALLQHELDGAVSLTRNYKPCPEVACYPGQLNQVFLNLLVNAKQALPEGQGEITISTRHADGRVEVTIRDNGRGIDPAHAARIFDPGFTTKEAGVGSGLGLSICYQIVRDHQGEISMESKPDGGAAFTVSIPDDLLARMRAPGPTSS